MHLAVLTACKTAVCVSVQVVCMTLDVDIICLPVTEKLPFVLKRAPVSGVSADGGLEPPPSRTEAGRV